VAILALVIVGLAITDTFLEKAQQAEVQAQGRESYSTGSLLLEQGKPDQAIEVLRKAHALDRKNVGYELALISALMAAGKISEAEPLMDEVLERNSNSGPANLIAARLMIRKGDTSSADAYYHRAIYGSWPNDADAHRMSARLELVDFLAANGRRQELLAELLPLREQAGNNPAVEPQLGKLFLAAGSPGRATEVYRSLVQQNSKDAAAYAGLGEAELQQGQFRAARAAFVSASVYNPSDALLRQRLELLNTLAKIDPTPRGLSSIEKYRRSIDILQMAQAAFEPCVAQHTGASSGEWKQLLTDAKNTISQKAPAHPANEISEQILALAQKLWRARVNLCGAANSTAEEPLRLIMAKLAE
jgi:tetratricopeptide (TPR) repeat protein